MPQVSDEGVVLRTYRLGEADRIVVLMTEGHGKVRAVAKGVRKTTSKLGARLEPLTAVSVLLWKGRSELMTVSQVEVLERHRTLREDLDRMTAGLALLEVVDQVGQDEHPDPALLATLRRALGVLDDPRRDPTLVAPAFFLRVLELEGAMPVLDACAACGDEAAELVAFDLLAGGALCRTCRRGRPLSPEALALLRAILGGGLGDVLAGAPPAGSAEVAQLATEAIEVHLDRHLRSIRSVAGL
jgi:DNA repair protein RecO (recombination protein O)